MQEQSELIFEKLDEIIQHDTSLPESQKQEIENVKTEINNESTSQAWKYLSILSISAVLAFGGIYYMKKLNRL